MSFNKKYNMRKILVIAFLSISLAFGSSAFAVHGQSNDFSNFSNAEILQLISQLQQILAQNSGQYQNSSAQAASSVYVSSGCSYTFTRDLTVGSSGSDVKKLQEFLNSDSSTLVAISGAGSKNQETNYFGPATKSAVAKFQNKYASEVLAPYGLTSGTGYFGPSTRSKANQVCSAQTVSSTSQQQQVEIPVQQSQNYNQNFVASGATLAVNSTQQPKNGIAVGGAQRVPYTNIVLTAGSSDVLVEGIRVQLQGVTKRDNFSGIAVIDASRSQLGSARTLRSDNSVVVGGRFTVQRGTSATLTIVGNVADSESGASVSGVGYLQVTEVLANTVVTGNFPIDGAQHTFSDALDLGSVDVTLSGNASAEETEIGERNVVFSEYELDLGGSGDQDAYLRSVTFEQNGSSDQGDIEDLVIRIDDRDSYKPTTVNGDRYTVVFPGDGVFIEDGESIDVSIEGTVVDGYGRTVSFDLDDISDVYVTGAKNFYGLPVTADGSTTGGLTSSLWTVIAGSADATDQNFLSADEEESIKAKDNQIIGAFEFEVEGEDIDVEDSVFVLTVTRALDGLNGGIFGFDSTSGASSQNEVDELEISDFKLVDYKTGKTVAEASDQEVLTPDSNSAADGSVEATFEFNSTYTLTEGEHEFVFTADLDDDFLTNTKFEITSFNWGDAEGVVTGKDLSVATNTTDPIATPSDVGDATIVKDFGAIILSSNVDSETVVAGSDDVEFAVVEFDASDSDVYVDFEEIVFDIVAGNGGDLGDLDNCELAEEDGDIVGNISRSLSSGTSSENVKFNFDDDLRVDAKKVAYISVQCDVDSDANAGDTYTFSLAEGEEVDYRIDGERETIVLGGTASEEITISDKGTLDINAKIANDSNLALGIDSSTSVIVGEIELQANQEDFELTELDVVVDGLSADESRYLERIEVSYNGNTESDQVTSNGDDGTGVTAEFDLTNWVFEENKRDQIEVRAVFSDMEDRTDVDVTGYTDSNRDRSGKLFNFSVVRAKYVGEESNNSEDEDLTIALGTVKTYKSLPEFVNVSPSNDSLAVGASEATLYRFAVKAQEYDIALHKVTVHINPTDVDLANVKIKAYTSGSDNRK